MMTSQGDGEFALAPHPINFGRVRLSAPKGANSPMYDPNEGLYPGVVQQREVTDAGPDAGLAAVVPSHH